MLDHLFATASLASQGEHPRVSECRKKVRWLIDEGAKAAARDDLFQCVMTITPEMAAVMLERNQSDEWRNRPQSKANTSRIVTAMRDGRWRLTGEPIIFSAGGDLLNGQHRLFGCVDAARAFRTAVAAGVERSAFDVMDTGSVRSLSHILAINGVASYTAVSTLVVWVYRYERNWVPTGGGIDNDLALDFYKSRIDPELAERAVRIGVKIGRSRLMPQRSAEFCFYVCARKSRRQAEEFFTKLSDVFGWDSKDDPAFKLYSKLDKIRAQGELIRADPLLSAAMTIRAWNLMREPRRHSKRLEWRVTDSAEPFPRAV